MPQGVAALLPPTLANATLHAPEASREGAVNVRRRLLVRLSDGIAKMPLGSSATFAHRVWSQRAGRMGSSVHVEPGS